MSGVQNGGVGNIPQTVINNCEVRNRSIPDQAFVCCKEYFIDHVFRKVMRRGTFHAIRGTHESGKTTLLVNLMQLLVNGYDKCGDWEVITNVFFIKEGGETIVGNPERIHHVDYFDEIIQNIGDIVSRGSTPAVILDDIECFYSDEDDVISENIRKLITNRKKLGIMVVVCGEGQNRLYEDMIGPQKQRFDYEWGKLDENNYTEFRENDVLSVDLPYQDGSFVTGRLDGIDTYFTSKPFGWTDFDSNGWKFDRYSEASFVRCRQSYDMDLFWDGFGNIPSVRSMEYIKEFFEHRKTTKDQPGPANHDDDVVEMTARMKSIGLTDEAIEFVVGKPKTTLRRWVERKGYEWRTGSIESPYLFKRIRDEELTPELDQA
jgi:hypothetical protein